MANPAILEYLNEHLGKYSPAELRAVLLEEGCDPAEVDEALKIITQANSILDNAKKSRRRLRLFVAGGAALGAVIGAWIALNKQDKTVSLNNPRAVTTPVEEIPQTHEKQVDFFTLSKKYDFPAQVNALDSKGLQLMAENKWQEALDTFNQSLAVMPKNPRALANRGTVRGALNQPEQAIEDYRAALALNPEIAPLIRTALGEAYVKLGQKSIDNRDAQAASQYLNSAMEVDPQNAMAFSEMGALSILMGDYNSCLKYLNHAAALNPNLEEAFANRGGCLSALGRFSEALSDLNRAIELNSERAESYGSRSGVRYSLGNYEGAMEDAEKALKLNPSLKNTLDPVIQDIRKALKK